MKVSVIVPVYNAENYLEKCISSILEQTYSDLELILVNDGSTDQSAKICYEFQEKDERVQVYTIPNGGVGHARNTGLSYVRGDYILFVDNDDWLMPNCIEYLYENLKKYDSDVAVASFSEYEEETGLFLTHLGPDSYFEKSYTVEEWFTEQYNPQNRISQCFTVPWSKLYKADLFKTITYPIDENVEDDYTTWKVYLRASKIVFLNIPLYYYRRRPTSVTQSVNLADVFPLKSIEERVTVLSLLGMDISRELSAYRWRLAIHKEALLKAGKTDAYRKVVDKLTLLEKYGQK